MSQDIPKAGDSVPPALGAYSPSVRAGSIVWVSGQGGFDPATGELAGDDVGRQTLQALANVKTALAASGANFKDVVRVGAFITTPDDFAAFDEAYRECWDSGPLPARSTVSVGLPGGMKVEIDAMAVVDS